MVNNIHYGSLRENKEFSDLNFLFFFRLFRFIEVGNILSSRESLTGLN